VIAECHILLIIVLNIIMLNVIVMNVIMLNVIMLNVIMLNVIMLNVMILNSATTVTEWKMALKALLYSWEQFNERTSLFNLKFNR
jgi:hypothetical protein